MPEWQPGTRNGSSGKGETVEPERLEVESEAWYRAIAEGRLAPVSDRTGGQVWLPVAVPRWSVPKADSLGSPWGKPGFPHD